ncbi:PfaD family polyunsaturated fatty acid/polyketide biosynthesis protein [Pseudoalteromonas sp. OOF1S-7]|uniref:PfaD family polyunsaturated fatty acid/polyketide biosynthesis protein n=1 Tax=Pseudoalteromonas sp. OOF1S-7 TaxID=2917757 RepID=UPI001EF3FDB9|nr:PfaD family polyunsaturated fatty acid/polyketide biosynthesis protein [Pseudoalteromonas sp. OOF1S-7]MCG7534509.1 PfaD family polyunsaturated fatty acid/polyketide biosynthesis protein [Pseudoalteromonas sp. OOF1S-7]
MIHTLSGDTSPNQFPAISAQQLGAASFRRDYGVKYAYASGGMYRGIASTKLVIAMAQAGLLSFFGSGGLSVDVVDQALNEIQSTLTEKQNFGLNLVCNLTQPEQEMALVELCLKRQVRCLEAAAFIRITPALVLYRLRGLARDEQGQVVSTNKLMAKVSRPEVASAFLSPAPDNIVAQLLADKQVTLEQAELSKQIAMCDDLCVEADSGGHTDQGMPAVLLPAMQLLRDTLSAQYQFNNAPRVGLAGGIGTPASAAAAFMMGADFILTGSINQCTVEADTSAAVKTLLQDINVQDTDYAPAGDMFELGAKVQVLKKGVFFPARAQKLYQLYQHYPSLDAIPATQRAQLEDKVFKKTFAEIWQETRQYLHQQGRNEEVMRAERDPKYKMARVFRWYFAHSMKLAFAGATQERVNFQVHTGPALGAFNQWVKGTDIEPWQQRHVASIAQLLMTETAAVLTTRTRHWLAPAHVD